MDSMARSEEIRKEESQDAFGVLLGDLMFEEPEQGRRDGNNGNNGNTGAASEGTSSRLASPTTRSRTAPRKPARIDDRNPATRPWTELLARLAGRSAEPLVDPPQEEGGPRERKRKGAALPALVHPQQRPWATTLALLAGRREAVSNAALSAGSVENGTTPARWKNVAAKSPGLSVEEFVAGCKWE